MRHKTIQKQNQENFKLYLNKIITVTFFNFISECKIATLPPIPTIKEMIYSLKIPFLHQYCKSQSPHSKKNQYYSVIQNHILENPNLATSSIHIPISTRSYIHTHLYIYMFVYVCNSVYLFTLLHLIYLLGRSALSTVKMIPIFIYE